VRGTQRDTYMWQGISCSYLSCVNIAPCI